MKPSPSSNRKTPRYGTDLVTDVRKRIGCMPAYEMLIVGLITFRHMFPRELGLRGERARFYSAQAKSLMAALEWVAWAKLPSNSRLQSAKAILRQGARLEMMLSARFDDAAAQATARRPNLAQEISAIVIEAQGAAEAMKVYYVLEEPKLKPTNPAASIDRLFGQIESKLKENGLTVQAGKMAALRLACHRALKSRPDNDLDSTAA